MCENKLKHLEFIHNTINRMSTNSFIIKGWVITLISALFVLSDKTANPKYILLSYFAIPPFWFLNSYFLLQERKYRELYDEVRVKSEEQIDFSMEISNYNSGRTNIFSCIIAKSIWPLYVFMSLITLLIMFVF